MNKASALVIVALCLAPAAASAAKGKIITPKVTSGLVAETGTSLDPQELAPNCADNPRCNKYTSTRLGLWHPSDGPKLTHPQGIPIGFFKKVEVRFIVSNSRNQWGGLMRFGIRQYVCYNYTGYVWNSQKNDWEQTGNQHFDGMDGGDPYGSVYSEPIGTPANIIRISDSPGLGTTMTNSSPNRVRWALDASFQDVGRWDSGTGVYHIGGDATWTRRLDVFADPYQNWQVYNNVDD